MKETLLTMTFTVVGTRAAVIQAEQSKRTDQLYQMFIDLLKERK